MKRTRAQKDADERAEIDHKRSELQAASDKRHDEAGPPKGCGDNSCIVEAPKGMATNGGCRCEPITIRMALKWYKYEYDRARRVKP